MHGLYYTSKIGDRYVNVTSLPHGAGRPTALRRRRLPGRPCCCPCSGAVAAAFAARALARRLRPATTGGRDDGWAAFWVVGLASPLRDLRPRLLGAHASGVGFMAWARGRRSTTPCSTSRRGGAVWLAGVGVRRGRGMRTEAFVYVFDVDGAWPACVLAFARRRQIVGAVGHRGHRRGRFRAGLRRRTSLLEVAVLGAALRAGRATGAASARPDLGRRAGSRRRWSPSCRRSRRSTRRACVRPARCLLARADLRGPCVGAQGRRAVGRGRAVVAGLVLLWRLSTGSASCPGWSRPRRSRSPAWRGGCADERNRFVALAALVPLPLVFVFQFTGGAAPQWAGRYILTTRLPARGGGHRQRARAGGVGAHGFVVASRRRHRVRPRCGSSIAATRSPTPPTGCRPGPEAVLISPNGLRRRASSARTYGDKHWLSTGNPDDLRFAVDVVAASRASRRSALVDLDTVGRAAVASPGGTHRARRSCRSSAARTSASTTYERA